MAASEVLLVVPEELVKSMTEYSREPSLVYAYRHALAEAIKSARIAPVHPWDDAL